VVRLAASGVPARIAVTDHDSTAFHDRLAYRPRWLTAGVEITCSLDRAPHREIHILCYFPDLAARGRPWRHPAFRRLLERCHWVKARRFELIAGLLALGAERKEALVRTCRADGVPPAAGVATCLLERAGAQAFGWPADSLRAAIGEAERTLIRTGTLPSFPRLRLVARTLATTGGLWGLAHPARYGWSWPHARRIVDWTVTLGASGLEVYHLPSGRQPGLRSHARSRRLVAFAGSDCHDLSRSRGDWRDWGANIPARCDLAMVYRYLR